jgi:hypothetical protein
MLWRSPIWCARERSRRRKLSTQAAEAVARIDPQIEAVLGLYEDVSPIPTRDGPSHWPME